MIEDEGMTKEKKEKKTVWLWNEEIKRLEMRREEVNRS